MKRISLEILLKEKQQLSYEQQYAYIMDLMEAQKLKPLKASGKNGKKPALYREYWLTEEKKDYSSLLEELKFRLVPAISIDYYLQHPEVYQKERVWVLMLNDYLKESRDRLRFPESANERSFEIWSREKFLLREQGKKILKHCGMGAEALNIYDTTEPLAYYSRTREVPQNLLILENKDTFYSMRRHLLEGKEEIFGMSAGTLIYGAGKGILRSFQDFKVCAEPYMTNPENRIYYFGDLDYEGIGIWEKLAELYQAYQEILPFAPAYEAMLEKAGKVRELPDTKEQQNRNISGVFFQYFGRETAEEMQRILESGKYIPQEILNITDF